MTLQTQTVTPYWYVQRVGPDSPSNMVEKVLSFKLAGPKLHERTKDDISLTRYDTNRACVLSFSALANSRVLKAGDRRVRR